MDCEVPEVVIVTSLVEVGVAAILHADCPEVGVVLNTISVAAVVAVTEALEPYVQSDDETASKQ